MRSQLSALCTPPPGSLGPSTLWDLWICHNLRIFLPFSEVFSDYVHPVLHMVFFLTASDFSFRERVVSRGMENPAGVYVSRVGKRVVLRVHNLALKVGPFLFGSPILVLSQCTTSLTSL